MYHSSSAPPSLSLCGRTVAELDLDDSPKPIRAKREKCAGVWVCVVMTCISNGVEGGPESYLSDAATTCSFIWFGAKKRVKSMRKEAPFRASTSCERVVKDLRRRTCLPCTERRNPAGKGWKSTANSQLIPQKKFEMKRDHPWTNLVPTTISYVMIGIPYLGSGDVGFPKLLPTRFPTFFLIAIRCSRYSGKPPQICKMS
jgi:hypothetical protein